MDRSRKGFIFITRTGIHLIMTQKTLLPFLRKTISAYIKSSAILFRPGRKEDHLDPKEKLKAARSEYTML